MPWEHCGATVLDDQPCPACGCTKETWTVDFQTPRTFKVTRRLAARFVVLDADAPVETPVPGVGWRATLPGGAAAEGETDELGAARVNVSTAGAWTLELPEVRPGELIAVSPDPEPSEEELPAGEAAGVRLSLRVGTRYEVRIRPRLEVRLVAHGEPLASRRYRLRLGDDEDTGTLDDQGVLRATVPAGVTEAEVFVDDGEGGELHVVLAVEDALAPIDQPTGLQQRLTNLGFDCGDEDGALGPATARALRTFQRAHGLEVTGEADAPTRDALIDRHGG